MRARLLGALPMLVALAVICPRFTLAVNVPGDYLSIQATLDAGATQILVADGTYHEVLSVTHDVELLPQPPSPWDQALPFPRVDGISITINSNTDQVYVRGFHFRGAAIQHNTGLGGHCTQTFESCWLDAGLEFTGTWADPIQSNIAYDNSGPGLRWTGTGTPFRGCDDWYRNSGGATGGIAPGATALAMDPLFCNAPADLVALSSISPLVNAQAAG